LSIEQVFNSLNSLKELGIIDYIPNKGENTITFLKPCIDAENIYIPDIVYEDRKKIILSNADALISYITNQTKCRSQLLLEYFGEESIIRCGRCDVCVSRNNVDLSKLEMDNIINVIKPLLREQAMSENELLEHFSIMDEIKVIRVISWLIETNKIIRLPDMNYLGINKYCKFNCLIIIIGMEELTEELITKLSTYHWSIIVAHDLNLCIGKIMTCHGIYHQISKDLKKLLWVIQ